MNYPPNPSHIPDGLTKVSKKYTQKVATAVLGLILFFLLYFSMVIGFAYLAYASFMKFQTYRGDIWDLALAVGAFMLFLFTLKFIFKKDSYKDKLSVSITRKDHPDLYDFVHKIADDANAPKPKKILIDQDVNASVSFHSTFWSLFTPGKKNLRIGLGLVNGLNLTEFKAVIAHEFGHFSQSSMRIGSYVYMTNKIIHDMIFERDYWDRALEIWRSIDIRLSFIAWIITPFVWLIRQLLLLLYRLLNMLHASLSREMEFHADKVAVSLTGSKAIVSALWNLEHINLAWNDTLGYTGTAATQKIYTKNLFAHQNNLLEEKKEKIAEEVKERELDAHGNPIIFKEEETYSSLSMYASHPASKDRENNAKTPFIDGAEDNSSPWQLFIDPHKIQEEITKRMYLHAMQVTPENLVQSTQKMSSFIADERQTEQILGEEYMGNFQERYFTVPDRDLIVSNNPFKNLSLEEVKSKFSILIKEKLPGLMEPVKEFTNGYQTLVDMSNGVNKSKVFEYKGTNYKKKNIQHAAERISKERLEYYEQAFTEWDKELIPLSYIATKEEDRPLFLKELDMLEVCQNNLKTIVAHNNRIHAFYGELANSGSVSEADIGNLVRECNQMSPILSKSIETVEETDFIPLPNIETKEELLQILGKDRMWKTITKNSFENGTFGELIDHIENLIHGYNRVIFKITASILKPLEIL